MRHTATELQKTSFLLLLPVASEEQRLAGLTEKMSVEVTDLENELVTLTQRLKDEAARTKIAASDELRVRHERVLHHPE